MISPVCLVTLAQSDLLLYVGEAIAKKKYTLNLDA